VKRLDYRLTNESHETIIKLCDELGITFKELIDEALFYFMTNYKHDIKRRQQKHFLDVKTKETMKELHFYVNYYRRILQVVMPRLKTQGNLKHLHPLVKTIIVGAEEYFKHLSVENQVLVGEDLKQLQQFKELKYFEVWCEVRLPDDVKVLRAEKRK